MCRFIDLEEIKVLNLAQSHANIIVLFQRLISSNLLTKIKYVSWD